MAFSIGNIITLLVVLIILALYRQLDKNNRSLEKIKRYSDKIKEELDIYVDEKTVEVKNFAIDLEVHHKTGKEILSRIQSLEEQLDSKAGHVEKIYEKINGYDQVLNELNTMTLKVQENLNRLHEESEFVDKVGKRVKDAGLSVMQLEKSLTEIKKDFAKQNLKDLHTVRALVAKDTKEYVSKLHKSIEISSIRIKELESEVSKFEERKDVMVREAVDTMSGNFDEQIYRAEQAGEQLKSSFREHIDGLLHEKVHQAESLKEEMDSVLTGLSSQMNEKSDLLNRMLEDFTQNVNSIESSYKKALQNTAARGRKLEDEAFDTLKEDINTRIGTERKEFSKQLEEVRNSLYEDFSQFQNTFSSYMQDIDIKYKVNITDFNDLEQKIHTKFLDMEKSISEYEEEITYRFSRIEEIGSDLDDLDKNLRSAMDRTALRIEGEFSAYEKDLEGQRESYKQKFNSEMEDITQSLSSLENELNDLKTRAYENVSEKLKIFEDDFFTNLQTRI